MVTRLGGSDVEFTEVFAWPRRAGLGVDANDGEVVFYRPTQSWVYREPSSASSSFPPYSFVLSAKNGM